MPVVVHRGYDGSVQYGTANTVIAAIVSWEATVTQEIEEQGPFLADSGTVYTSRGAKRLEFTFEGVVPSGRDAGQTATKDAIMNGTDIALRFVNNYGYTITVAAATITEMPLGQEASNTATFAASGRDNGGFTISP